MAPATHLPPLTWDMTLVPQRNLQDIFLKYLTFITYLVYCFYCLHFSNRTKDVSTFPGYFFLMKGWSCLGYYWLVTNFSCLWQKTRPNIKLDCVRANKAQTLNNNHLNHLLFFFPWHFPCTLHCLVGLVTVNKICSCQLSHMWNNLSWHFFFITTC